MIENTAKRDPMVHLLGAMSDGSSGYIEGMERAGQSQLVNSTDLPTRMGEQAEYEKLGFTFAEGGQRDRLFRSATLPEGWKREGSDHAMWSYIVDGLGRRRVSVFYKAAFYDRDAFMSLETPTSYLRSALYDGRLPVLDDVWLTRAVADATLAALRDASLKEAAEADDLATGRRDDYWAGRAKEHRASAAKAEKMLARLAAS